MGMVNDTGILVVSRIGSNTTRVASSCVMMDLGAQPVMINNKLAQELGLAVRSPLLHLLVTWSEPQVILGSHYSLASE